MAMQNHNIRVASKSIESSVSRPAWPAGIGSGFSFVAPEYGVIRQLLDIGGGAGLMASLMKRHNPHLKITIFDQPDLCEAALELFRENGQGDDLGAHAANIHRDPLPSGFEAIQIAARLAVVPPGRMPSLLHKAFDVLPPGGLLLVYGPMALESDMPAPEPSHDLRPAAHYQEWLNRLGFTPLACRRCPGRHVLLSAVK